MKRLIPQALLVFFFTIIVAANLSATTYYIAANGSDSNNGTSKTSPWQHAPGMPNCTATCGATNPQPGDKFIFRGGDTWHFSNSGASPYTGGSWRFNYAGSSSNCNVDALAGAIVTSSCIYIGVDQTWYTGSTWVRPVMTMDNPLSKGFVSNCTYDNSGFNGIFLGRSYIVFDNFDIQGNCSGASATAAWVTYRR